MPGKNEVSQFDCSSFIARHGGAVTNYRANTTVYNEGDSADALYYIIMGSAKIIVTSPSGKEAVIAIFAAGDFFGEACLDVNPLRTATIVTASECKIGQFTKIAVLRALKVDLVFSELLTNFVLFRNEKLKSDLTNHLFNSSEKRLARILLTLSNIENDTVTHIIAMPINQDVLAKMVGTTRPRINTFMNKFRKLGYIKYNGKIEVYKSLVNIVAMDN